MHNHSFLDSAESFARFLADWETCVLPKAAWTHAAHVAAGAAYVVRYGPEAFGRMKNGILAFNEAVGTANTETSGYHETLTRMWIDVLREAVDGASDPWRAACHAVALYGHRSGLYREYYSFDVVASAEARRTWVAPDLPGPEGVK
jgi:hypothetical protein